MPTMMDVAPDQLRAKTLLGTQATYRVLAVHRRHAVMQVVDVPGLVPGTHFRLSLPAVAKMDLVDIRGEVDAGLASLLSRAA